MPNHTPPRSNKVLLVERDGRTTRRLAERLSDPRSQRPGLRVVVVTGYPSLLVREAFGNSPLLVMAEPFDSTQLLQELQDPINAPETGALPASPRS